MIKFLIIFFINQNSSQGILKNSDFTSRSFQINLRRNGKFYSFKLEGNYKNSTTPSGDTYSMHIGGFSGEENFLRKCSFNLTNPIRASKNKSSKVFYNVRINEIFSNPLVIDFNTYNVVGGGRKAQEMADNYKDMFVIDRIEN